MELRSGETTENIPFYAPPWQAGLYGCWLMLLYFSYRGSVVKAGITTVHIARVQYLYAESMRCFCLTLLYILYYAMESWAYLANARRDLAGKLDPWRLRQVFYGFLYIKTVCLLGRWLWVGSVGRWRFPPPPGIKKPVCHWFQIVRFECHSSERWTFLANPIYHKQAIHLSGIIWKFSKGLLSLVLPYKHKSSFFR